MLLQVVTMLKKRLGVEAIERDGCKRTCFKISSTLIIPEECVRIGWSSFWRCERLKKVNIPRSVKKLEHYAFWGCRKATIILKKPRSKFEFFGDDVFKGCKDVKYAKEKTRN